MNENGTVSSSTVKWGIGITLTVLIYVVSSLWSHSSRAAEKAAEIAVLEARANALDNAISSVNVSVEAISRSVQSMREGQAAFQAEMRACVENFKDDLKRLQVDPRFGSPVGAGTR